MNLQFQTTFFNSFYTAYYLTKFKTKSSYGKLSNQRLQKYQKPYANHSIEPQLSPSLAYIGTAFMQNEQYPWAFKLAIIFDQGEFPILQSVSWCQLNKFKQAGYQDKYQEHQQEAAAKTRIE